MIRRIKAIWSSSSLSYRQFLIIPAVLPDRGVHFSFIAQKLRPGWILAAETGVWF
jgi:hypothetical protein